MRKLLSRILLFVFLLVGLTNVNAQKFKGFSGQADTYVSELKELLNKSINRLIHNKYDYGALLSGGIDSSIVALLANKINLDTYFLEYNNNDLYFKKNDFQRDLDKKYALIMSKYLNSNMEILSINEEELFNNLISSLKARDLPGMGDIHSSLYWLCNNINNTL